MKVIDALKYTDRDLIEAILNSYFIVDYGFVSKVNDDGTIDVTHARKGVTTDGEVLPEYRTHGVEFLVFSCAEFSIKVNPKKGDGVVLLGLKDLVETVKDLTQAEEPKVFVHYDRATIKAVPLSLFNGEAKITLTVDDGNAELEAAGDISASAGGNVEIKADGNAEMKAGGNIEASADGTLEFKSKDTMTLTAGASAETLGGLLADLGTILQGLTTTGAAGEAAVSPASIAALASWAGRLQSAFL